MTANRQRTVMRFKSKRGLNFGSGADWAQQPKLAQQSGGLRAGLAPELIDDIVQVKANGRLLDSDKVRNLGFAIALRQCPDAVPFTWCETRAFIGSIGIAIQCVAGNSHEPMSDGKQVSFDARENSGEFIDFAVAGPNYDGNLSLRQVQGHDEQCRYPHAMDELGDLGLFAGGAIKLVPVIQRYEERKLFETTANVERHLQRGVPTPP
jgi:hypothetical protein